MWTPSDEVVMTANETTRGTVDRATEGTGTTNLGNPGVLIGTQDVAGQPYARYRATNGTWVSASLQEQGYATLYGRNTGYGAYAGLVRSSDGTPLTNPDRIRPGQEYLVPIVRATQPAPGRTEASPRTTDLVADAEVRRGIDDRYGGSQPLPHTQLKTSGDADRAISPNNRFSGSKQAPQGSFLRPGQHVPTTTSSPPAPYPKDLAKFSSWLIRQGYVKQVTTLIAASWRSMPEEALTRELASRFTEDQLAAQFKGLAAERQAIKEMARRGSLIAALVIGLIWARENIKHDEWDKAIAKVSASTISAALINRALYARDRTAAQIMERNAGRFGKWFQGVARTNRFVNRLSELGMVSIVATLGLSGGGELPSIPWDVIYDVDIDDPRTWTPPSQRLLDYGFNIWYRQKPTAAHPEAEGRNMFLATVYGSPVPLVYGIVKDAFLPGEAQ